MSESSTQPKPVFFWQGFWILLPVAVLSVISLIALRQDERTAEQDARNRAAADAQGLAAALRSSVDDEFQRFLTLQNTWMMGLRQAGQPDVTGEFPGAGLEADIARWESDYPGLKLAELAVPAGEILVDGREIDPPDFPFAPVPAKWFRELAPAQKDLWERLRTAEGDAEIGRRRLAFLNSNPSDPARQAADFLFRPPGQVIANSDALPTETGISFEEIDCCRLLSAPDAQLTAPLLQSIWWQVTGHPSFLSSKLLALAGELTNRASPVIQEEYFRTQQYWDGQSKAREWLGPLRGLPELASHWNPPTFWAHWTCDPTREALAFFAPCTFTNMGADAAGVAFSGRGYEVWFVPWSVVDAIFDRALAANKFLIPAYARPALTIEGKTWSPAAYPVAPEQTLLGAVSQKAGPVMTIGAANFELRLYLTSREQMLSGERRRLRLFAGLVLGALLAALAGLLAAQRAFRRQLQLNELKSNFVSSVSHELRAPIASVRLMAENLERGKIHEPQKQNEYFRFIVQECRRLSALIENVLDFSRIEQGRKQYEFEPTDLVALAQTTVRLLEPYAAEKGVRLQWEPPAADGRLTVTGLTVDGRAIQQALVNLIDNAIKHSARDQVVTVGLAIRGAPVKTAGLFVADNGPGIPRAEQEKIFERFYRLGSELRRETQGVGIGLSVVKHIVTAHKGRVKVDSEPGRGSRFTMELPLE